MGETKTLGVRLDERTTTLVRLIADDLVVSPAWILRRALDQYLRNLEAYYDIAEGLQGFPERLP